MNAKCRKTFQMAVRVDEFSTAQPDTDAGQNVLAGRLKELRTRMERVAANQRAGLINVRAGSLEKRRLRREMLAGPIAHLAEIGHLAGREQHELGSAFQFKPGAGTYVAFRTAARGMQSEAQSHKEVLAKHGLSESVLDLFGQMLDQFDAAVTLGSDGRAAHTGATQDLETLASEILQTVRAMDARNRYRFRDDGQLLGSWINASTVFGSKRGGTVAAEAPEPETGPEVKDGGTPAVGDVRPAA